MLKDVKNFLILIVIPISWLLNDKNYNHEISLIFGIMHFCSCFVYCFEF
jgi:hypothetical protein